jgi:hypothetical protein
MPDGPNGGLGAIGYADLCIDMANKEQIRVPTSKQRFDVRDPHLFIFRPDHFPRKQGKIQFSLRSRQGDHISLVFTSENMNRFAWIVFNFGA